MVELSHFFSCIDDVCSIWWYSRQHLWIYIGNIADFEKIQRASNIHFCQKIGWKCNQQFLLQLIMNVLFLQQIAFLHEFPSEVDFRILTRMLLEVAKTSQQRVLENLATPPEFACSRILLVIGLFSLGVSRYFHYRNLHPKMIRNPKFHHFRGPATINAFEVCMEFFFFGASCHSID